MNKAANELATLKRSAQELQSRTRYVERIEKKLKTCNGETEAAIFYLKTKFMSLEEVVENFEGIETKIEFWAAFANAIDDLPYFDDISKFVCKCFNLTTIDKQGWEIFKNLGKYDFVLFWVALKHEDLDEARQQEIASLFAELFPALFLRFSREYTARADKFAHLYAPSLKRLPIRDQSCRSILLYTFLPTSEDFWTNRDVAITWGRAGGSFLRDRFAAEFKEDRDILSAFTFCGPDYAPPSLILLPDHLRGDKAFMLEKVHSHPVFLDQIDDSLVGDMDLLFAALRDERALLLLGNLGLRRWAKEGTESKFVRSLVNSVREKLYLYNIFIKVLLPAMTLPIRAKALLPATTPETSSPFLMLCQGEATTLLAYKKTLAEFLGVPLGEQLLILRAVSQTLKRVGLYPWDD